MCRWPDLGSVSLFVYTDKKPQGKKDFKAYIHSLSKEDQDELAKVLLSEDDKENNDNDSDNDSDF